MRVSGRAPHGARLVFARVRSAADVVYPDLHAIADGDAGEDDVDRGVHAHLGIVVLAGQQRRVVSAEVSVLPPQPGDERVLFSDRLGAGPLVQRALTDDAVAFAGDGGDAGLKAADRAVLHAKVGLKPGDLRLLFVALTPGEVSLAGQRLDLRSQLALGALQLGDALGDPSGGRIGRHIAQDSSVDAGGCAHGVALGLGSLPLLAGALQLLPEPVQLLVGGAGRHAVHLALVVLLLVEPEEEEEPDDRGEHEAADYDAGAAVDVSVVGIGHEGLLSMHQGGEKNVKELFK